MSKIYKPNFVKFNMDSFIKKIFGGNGEEAHYQFVRFGKGRFENRAVLNLRRTEKIKLRGSFEWANDFVNLTNELSDVVFSGVILSREEIDNILNNNDVKFDKMNKKGLYVYEIEKILNDVIKEIKDRVYIMLLDGECDGIVLKMKKKLPKLGKSSEKKVDDKFCQLELDLKYWPQIKEVFMLPECKKCKISHIFKIEELIIPEELKEEKDFAKIREMAKRKGKIIRELDIDGRVLKKEKDFIV